MSSQWNRRGVLAPVALAVLVALAACSAKAFEAGSVAHGHLHRVEGLWVLELDGTPAERGKAAGQLLGTQIRWALPRYLRAALHADEPTGHALALIRRLEATIPRPHLEELDALAAAAGIDRDVLLVANLAPEVAAGLACSCLAVTGDKSGTGVSLMARNLDWLGGDVLRELGLLVIEPGERGKLASLTYPGLVGVVSGMNSHGLSAANLVAHGHRAQPSPGVPVMFLVRSILETTDTVESAVALVQDTARTVPQNYMLADPITATVLETGPTRLRRRDPVAGALAVANLFDEDKKSRPGSRYLRMVGAARQPVLGIDELKDAMRAVAMGNRTIHSVIFEPATLTLHASTRSRPAAKGPYARIDLGPMLRAGTTE